MSSGYGENSKPSANSDAYRNSPFWDRLKKAHEKGKKDLEESKENKKK